MYNSPVTITGRIIDDPAYHLTPDKTDGVMRIRVASSRSYLKDGKWKNVDTLYVNVEAWGRLGVNAHQALLKGTAVIVQGMLYTNEWVVQKAEDTPDGKAVTRQEIRLRATSIGVDMSFYKVGFKDARPQLESNLHEVELADGQEGFYPSFVSRTRSTQETESDSSAETPANNPPAESPERQDQELVGAGAGGEGGGAGKEPPF